MNERRDHVPRLELHEDKTMSLRAAPTHKTGKGHTKVSEAMMYNPRVARIDMTMFRKIEFVNSELGDSGPSVFAMFSIPLKARKKAAICHETLRQRVAH